MLSNTFVYHLRERYGEERELLRIKQAYFFFVFGWNRVFLPPRW